MVFWELNVEFYEGFFILIQDIKCGCYFNLCDADLFSELIHSFVGKAMVVLVC